jgi:hypothetical protein
MLFYQVLVLSMLFLSSALASAHSTPIILGVLEDHPGHHAGDPNFRAIRVLFRRNADDWHTLPNECRSRECLEKISSKYPQEVVWTIAFDGNRVGELKARTQTKFHNYWEVGLQDIAKESTVPTIGAPSVEYSGFFEKPVLRPLVANSQPNFEDPDKWKPTQASVDLSALLRDQFRKKFPKLCRETKPESGQLNPYPYRDDEIAIRRAYSSTTGWVVAKVHIEAIDCQDTEAGFDIDDPWFVVSPHKTVTYLDSGMWLVDAGDYDNDGKSELVFSIDRYNRGGYELYYDDFKKHVTFEFGYH